MPRQALACSGATTTRLIFILDPSKRLSRKRPSPAAAAAAAAAAAPAAGKFTTGTGIITCTFTVHLYL